MMFEKYCMEHTDADMVQKGPHKTEKRCYSVGDIQRILDISRSTAYVLIRRNVFKSQKVGKQIRISKKSFDSWLDGE